MIKNFILDEATVVALQSLATDMGESCSEVVRQALRSYISLKRTRPGSGPPPKLANKLVKKYGGRCCGCGKTIEELRKEKNKYYVNSHKNRLDLHHKDFNPENNKPTNLRLYCKSCHDDIHHPQRVAKREANGKR